MLRNLAFRLARVSLTEANPVKNLSTTSALSRNLDSRRVPIFKEPSKNTGKWEPWIPYRERYEYTVEPLPMNRTGGRGPNGRIWNHRRGGGLKKEYRMISKQRDAPEADNLPENGELIERIKEIIPDKCRTAHIALVTSGEKKRWIIANDSMKVGDLIKTTRKLTETPIRAQEGDAHPVGSLPIGTIISCIERQPGKGAQVAVSAGTSAQIVRKVDDSVIIKMPSKREMEISRECLAVVGRVSNVDHNKKKFKKFGEKRWLGIRPRSGRWHRKDGRFGRKIKPMRPAVVYNQPLEPPKEVFTFTM